jgi:hypothetical protein
LGQNDWRGLGVRCDGGDRQREQHARDGGVDFLVVLDLTVAQIEEGLPADVAARRRVAAEQVGAVVVDRSVEVRLVDVEHQGEEWVRGRGCAVAGAAGEIGSVRRADHAVPEPVRGGAELDRHERSARWWPIEPVAMTEHVVDDGLAANLGQVFIDE